MPCGGLSFSTLQQPLRGTPIRQGKLWYLSAEDQAWIYGSSCGSI